MGIHNQKIPVYYYKNRSNNNNMGYGIWLDSLIHPLKINIYPFIKIHGGGEDINTGKVTIY